MVYNYQNFTFHKSFFKKFFFQLDHDFDETQTRSDNDEMKERISNRKPFWFGYDQYLCMNCCLCCRSCMRKKDSKYYKRYNEFQKFKVAELELNRETDLETYIYNARILKLIIKALLSKR